MSKPIPAKFSDSWAIVGGGMLGLSLALRLAQKNQRVTLLEAAPELGGLASVWDLNGITWDRHYHVISTTDTILRDLLNEIGLEKQIKWVETKTGFYSGGELYSMSNSMEFLKFPPLNLIEKFSTRSDHILCFQTQKLAKVGKNPGHRMADAFVGQRNDGENLDPLVKSQTRSELQKSIRGIHMDYDSTNVQGSTDRVEEGDVRICFQVATPAFCRVWQK